MGLQGLLAVSLPALFSPQSASLWVRSRVPSAWMPVSALLQVWTNVSSLSPWFSDFRVVRFSVSSGCFLFLNCCCPFGCARRRSVSTYASILVSSFFLFLKQGCQTHFHRGPFELRGCRQRAKIILGLNKCNYFLTVKQLKLHSAL